MHQYSNSHERLLFRTQKSLTTSSITRFIQLSLLKSFENPLLPCCFDLCADFCSEKNSFRGMSVQSSKFFVCRACVIPQYNDCAIVVRSTKNEMSLISENFFSKHDLNLKSNLAPMIYSEVKKIISCFRSRINYMFKLCIKSI